jgi:organic hydroperoxide reductase OsmC/OhrA
MNSKDVGEPSRTSYKSFTFRTSTNWTGGCCGTLSSEGKPALTIPGAPEFKSNGGQWSPEDMFVAAVEVCHMATFMAYANKSHIPILSYKSHANGVLEYVDGDYRFTRIVIFPTIAVPNTAVESQVHSMLREAQKHCLVSNSIASIVEVNPTIMVQ